MTPAKLRSVNQFLTLIRLIILLPTISFISNNKLSMSDLPAQQLMFLEIAYLIFVIHNWSHGFLYKKWNSQYFVKFCNNSIFCDATTYLVASYLQHPLLPLKQCKLSPSTLHCELQLPLFQTGHL